MAHKLDRGMSLNPRRKRVKWQPKLDTITVALIQG